MGEGSTFHIGNNARVQSVFKVAVTATLIYNASSHSKNAS